MRDFMGLAPSRLCTVTFLDYHRDPRKLEAHRALIDIARVHDVRLPSFEPDLEPEPDPRAAEDPEVES